MASMESVDDVLARSQATHGDARLVNHDDHAALLGFPFALGFEGRKECAEYQASLGDAANRS